MPLYEFNGSFDDFPAFRGAAEADGVVFLEIATVEDVIHIETADPVPSEHTASLTLEG
jgi:hypothetical protein